MSRCFSMLAMAVTFSTCLSAQISSADAGAFMGSWAVMLETPQGNLEQSLVLKDEGGKVIGEMSNQMQPGVQKITDISKKGADLVLKLTLDRQGNTFEAVITMTPDGSDKCKVTFDVNGGQITLSGTGTKK